MVERRDQTAMHEHISLIDLKHDKGHSRLRESIRDAFIALEKLDEELHKAVLALDRTVTKMQTERDVEKTMSAKRLVLLGSLTGALVSAGMAALLKALFGHP